MVRTHQPGQAVFRSVLPEDVYLAYSNSGLAFKASFVAPGRTSLPSFAFSEVCLHKGKDIPLDFPCKGSMCGGADQTD